MSDLKGHTPGPWKPCRAHEDFDGPYFEIDEEDRLYYENGPFKTIMAAGNKSVASAHDLFEFEEANAHLIAAAPDLLEALEYVIEQVPEFATVPGIKAAIAKAKGVANNAPDSE